MKISAPRDRFGAPWAEGGTPSGKCPPSVILDPRLGLAAGYEGGLHVEPWSIPSNVMINESNCRLEVCSPLLSRSNFMAISLETN